VIYKVSKKQKVYETPHISNINNKNQFSEP